ncbi:hypothetical protein B0T20DRAFT_391218 [Sordaria brevicollis]|uniref:Uncharacterized protein n=1 Tax=Sordaria brevicollis TaxID=83679 RepID=A0AAE0UCZ0_SORBR|nr:hypothetical protein B0T20DRAFT_391218 [Sordaria brevicollis]
MHSMSPTQIFLLLLLVKFTLFYCLVACLITATSRRGRALFPFRAHHLPLTRWRILLRLYTQPVDRSYVEGSFVEPTRSIGHLTEVTDGIEDLDEPLALLLGSFRWYSVVRGEGFCVLEIAEITLRGILVVFLHYLRDGFALVRLDEGFACY